MKRHLKRKESELLHNALGNMAAELADVEDSFHQETVQGACADAIKPNLGVQFFLKDKHFSIRECLILLVFSWFFCWCNSYNKYED